MFVFLFFFFVIKIKKQYFVFMTYIFFVHLGSDIRLTWNWTGGDVAAV